VEPSDFDDQEVLRYFALGVAYVLALIAMAAWVSGK
jgi:hypothetical protein